MKITFVTYHNWETKRHGGFHQFAKYAAEQGHEVVFFSFARPYYIYFKKDERLNKNILRTLSKGKIYPVNNGTVLNITWPTFSLPGFLRRYVPYRINELLMTSSLTPFKRFAGKYLNGTDCFVFESADGVLLAEKIRKLFPTSKLVYRPSDPLWERSNDFFNVIGERRMIEIADKIIVVNEQAISGYINQFGKSFDKEKCVIISNGVDLKQFTQKHPIPQELKHPKTACYVGAFLPDMHLIMRAANTLSDVKFIIITPHTLEHKIQAEIEDIPNLTFIPGIKPEEVAQWITNCNVVLQPFPKSMGYASKTSVNLTAQNYKAMACHKPIVAYQIPMYLSKYGIITTDNEGDFITQIKRALTLGEVDYPINIEEKDWGNICNQFLRELI